MMGVVKKTSSQKPIRARRGRRAAQSESSSGPSQTAQPDGLGPEERVWQVVAAIPRGHIATYGQVARLAGMPSHARYVGRTLSRLPAGSRLPWHRVVNAGRQISRRGDPDGESEQRRRLEQEGITFVGPRIAKAHLWDH